MHNISDPHTQPFVLIATDRERFIKQYQKVKNIINDLDDIHKDNNNEYTRINTTITRLQNTINKMQAKQA